MTDLASRLLGAITAKEEKARAASPSPWTLHRDSLGDDHWADISAADGSSPVDTESGAIGPNLATVEFIADNDPSSVLRRCAADRAIVEMMSALQTGPRADAWTFRSRTAGMVVMHGVLNRLAESYGLEVRFPR